MTTMREALEAAKVEHWAVSVDANGETVLTIASNMLSGHGDIESYHDTIRTCARHLLAFIGDPHPDAALSAPAPMAGEDEIAESAQVIREFFDNAENADLADETWQLNALPARKALNAILQHITPRIGEYPADYEVPTSKEIMLIRLTHATAETH